MKKSYFFRGCMPWEPVHAMIVVCVHGAKLGYLFKLTLIMFEAISNEFSNKALRGLVESDLEVIGFLNFF